MLKLLCLLALLAGSCSPSRQTAQSGVEAGYIQQQLTLESADRTAASQAQAIMQAFVPPKQFQLLEHPDGKLVLHCHFDILSMTRFMQMLNELRLIPGITILQP